LTAVLPCVRDDKQAARAVGRWRAHCDEAGGWSSAMPPKGIDADVAEAPQTFTWAGQLSLG
jgi:hypothetical protein